MRSLRTHWMRGARFDLAAFDASLLDAYFAVGDRPAALTASERYL